MGSLINRLKLFVSSSSHGVDYKMVIVVRTDIPMGKGKVGAQCAHAALECYRQGCRSLSHRAQFDAWLRVGQPKIVLRISGEQELVNLAKEAKKAGLVASLIRDAGKTQLQPGTTTVLGIGPAPNAVVDSLTAQLKLL